VEGHARGGGAHISAPAPPPAVRVLCVRVLAVVYELQIHLKVCRLEHHNNILQIIT